MGAEPFPSSCPTGKIIYRTTQQAHAAVERMARRPKPGARRIVSAYKCPECHLWHVTSPRKKAP